MKTKKYSSYEEIENDLQILKIQKEIHYQKIILNIDNAKQNFIPSKPIGKAFNFYKDFVSTNYGTIFKIVSPFIINWFLKRKRGK